MLAALLLLSGCQSYPAPPAPESIVTSPPPKVPAPDTALAPGVTVRPEIDYDALAAERVAALPQKNMQQAVFLIATTRWWSRFTRKHGVFRTMAISLLLHFPSHFAYTFVNAGNYIWLMTAVRLVQHVISLSIALPTNSLIYVNLPKADQTNYLSFYTIVRNVSTFLAMVVGTAVVAAMGENTWSFLGYPMGSVPTLMFVQSFLLIALALFIFSVEKKVRPAEEMEAAG